MGDGTDSKLANGTNGSQRTSIYNFDAKEQALANEERILQEYLIGELKNNNVKFSEDKLIFITKDKSGQIIWLEVGNELAGLKHIISRHKDDFFSKNNINESEISSYLQKVIRNGQIEYSREIIKNKSSGVEKLYRYNEEYYILTGIGTNGFLVSAYPINEKTAKKLKEKYNNE